MIEDYLETPLDEEFLNVFYGTSFFENYISMTPKGKI
jgi:hypothetical protein